MSDDWISRGVLPPFDVFPSVGGTDAPTKVGYLFSNKISYLAENKVGFSSKSLKRLKELWAQNPPLM